MAIRKPLVGIDGKISELPAGDSIGLTGATIEQVTLVLIGQTQTHEQILSRPGTLPSQSVQAWLGSSIDNELWQLGGVTVNAVCEVDQVVFYLSCQFFESGNINVFFKVE